MSTRQLGTILSAPVVAGPDDTFDMPSALNREIQGSFQKFADIPSRDAWSAAYPSRLPNTTAFVDDSGDGVGNWFEWVGDASTGSWGRLNDPRLIVKDAAGTSRVQDVRILEIDGATVAAGKNNGEAIVTIHSGGSGGTIQGITVTEDGTAHVGVETIETSGMKVSETSAGVVRIQPQIHVKSSGDVAQDWYVDKLVYDRPLRAEPMRDTESGPVTGVKLGLSYELFEERHVPSFLAYLQEPTEVTGRLNDTSGHHDGILWFGDKVTDNEPFIVADSSTKTYGIQEFDGLDPNVSGGNNYLIIYRVAMKGNAYEDGSVRIFLKERDQLGNNATGYLVDVNKQPMAAERKYRKGDPLGVLQVMAVVNAKTVKNFSCHVLDSFNHDSVILQDRTLKGTGLCIQALTPTCKTGEGLQQFELDTNQSIRVSSHFLGEDRLDINWLISRLPAPAAGVTDDNQILSNGMLFHSLHPMVGGSEKGYLSFHDNGTDTCDFYLGKIFTNEETILTRGKTIDISVSVIDRTNAFFVSALKWTGAADHVNDHIYSNRDMGGVILNYQWEEFGTLFIAKDPATGVFSASKTLTVPTDANNYAVIIRPLADERPCALKLSEFKVNVNPSISGFFIKDTMDFSESHLAYSEQHKRFYSDNTGFDSLRYTISNKEIPLPCGYEGVGLADITIDRTRNMVPGSSAPGNEGVLVFQNDGSATFNTSVRITTDQKTGTGATAQIWWAKLNPDNSYTELVQSKLTVTVPPDTPLTQVALPAFTIDVQKGDVFALRGKGDMEDGAYLFSASGDSPLMETVIDFNEATDAFVTSAELVPLADWDTRNAIDQRIYSFTGNALTEMVFDMVIPAGVYIGYISVVHKDKDVITSVVPTYTYDTVTKKLTIKVGSGVVDGRIYIEFWGNRL